MNKLILSSFFLCGLFLTGCSVRSSDSSFETVRSVIEERIPEKIVWREGAHEIKKQLLQEIQQEGLTQEKAVQLALINNPDLFAYYENLELGYADLLEAGLMQNPFFSASVRFPSQSSYHLNNLFDAAISFLDLFLIPLRKRAAEAEIKVIEAEVGQRVLDLVKEVQIHWLELKTLEVQLKEEGKRVELKQMAAALADLQNKAGNINALSARDREIDYEKAAENLKGLEADLEATREKMNRALGLFGKEAFWKVSGDIDENKEPDLPDLYQMEQAAVENRLDIEAVRRVGDTGMGEMFEMSRHVQRPPNFLPFSSPGPFGLIDMSGMFTIVKVREDITNYNDPGWYRQPSSSLLQEPPSKMRHDQMKMDGSMQQQDESSKQGMPAEMKMDPAQMNQEMPPPDHAAGGHTHNGSAFEIGDLHPVLLHFPIVLFLMVFAFDCLSLIGKVKESYYNVSHWIVIVGAMFAILTAITGLYAAELGHPGNSYVLLHRNWALATLVYSIGHALFRGYVIRSKKIFSAWIFVVISLINVSLISITAEYGGLVTRGKSLWMQFMLK